MTQEERAQIIAREIRLGSYYSDACALADAIAERQAKDAAEDARRDEAYASFTVEMHGDKTDEASAALAARYPGAATVDMPAAAGSYICIDDASANVYWRIYAFAWSANISDGADRAWYSDGHTTAAEALDAARAMLAESVRQMRADADQLEALLGVAEVPHG